MDNLNLTKLFQEAWNTLNVSHIKEVLSDNFEYGSQSVLETIRGKDEYLDYLKTKFELIRNSDDKISAQVGKFGERYCLLIAQHFSEPEFGGTFRVVENIRKPNLTNLKKGVLMLEFKEGLISKAHMCSITPTEHDIELI